MAMTQLIQKLGPLVLESAAAVSYLRKRMGESRPNGAEARLDALENAIEVQSTLNKTVDVQMNLIIALLEKARKRLQITIIALIATATLAALSLAVALMK
jgi:acetylglutamate synthase